MGRKEGLQVNVPSYFRCPISLDVMKSPVSLCTGVTYDRSSIQKWLQQGNNTCPATMQVLPTTDLVPNHTLHRLIQIWSQSQKPPPPRSTTDDNITNVRRPSDLLRDIHASREPLPLLKKLANVARDPDTIDDLAESTCCIPTLNGVLIRGGGNQGLDVLETAIGVLVMVLAKRSGSNGAAVKAMAATPTIASLLLVLKDGTSLSSRTDAARVLESIASLDPESMLLVAETDEVLPELSRLVIDESDPDAVEAGLSCLIAASGPRRARNQIVRTGIVPAIGRILSRPETPGPVAEKAMRLLEAASTCTEGRAAICEDAGTVVTGVVGRMMKVSKAATEHAVVVLWSVCHLFRDRRAQEAVTASNGLTKLLLLMQSNCSPAARGMAGDLLKIFRVNSKSCLESYDTKTTHIMPF